MKINKLFIITCLILIILNGCIFPIKIYATDKNNTEIQRIHFIKLSKNVGNCTLLQSTDENGKAIYGMVDAGRNDDVIKSNGTDGQIIKYLDELGVNEENFEFLIITHAHEDHAGGANTIIQKYQPKTVYLKNISNCFQNVYREKNDLIDKDDKKLFYSIIKTINKVNKTRQEKNKDDITLQFVHAPRGYNSSYPINNHTELNTAIRETNSLIVKSDVPTIKLGKCSIDIFNGRDWIGTTNLFKDVTDQNYNSLTVLARYNVQDNQNVNRTLSIYLGADLNESNISKAITELVGEVTIYQASHHGLFNGFSKLADNPSKTKRITANKDAKEIMKNLNPSYVIITGSYKKILDAYIRSDHNGTLTSLDDANRFIKQIINYGDKIDSDNAYQRILFTGGWDSTADFKVSSEKPNVKINVTKNVSSNKNLSVTKLDNNYNIITDTNSVCYNKFVKNCFSTDEIIGGSVVVEFSTGKTAIKRNLIGADVFAQIPD